jgi:hypothetical protein
LGLMELLRLYCYSLVLPKYRHQAWRTFIHCCITSYPGRAKPHRGYPGPA